MSGIHNKKCKLFRRGFKNFVEGNPVNTGAFHGNMGTAAGGYPVTELGKPGSKCGKFTDFRNGSFANRAGEDACNDDIFMYIQPAAFFKKVFHKVKLLSKYNQAGDLPEIIGTLLPVLPEGATICCTQRQKVYVDKRGKIHQGAIKLTPA